jgi:hypothetical protein
MNALPKSPAPSALDLIGALGTRCVHDLTSPVMVILGNVQMAEILAEQSPRLLQQLQNIRQAATDIGRVVDQMASLALKIEKEQIECPTCEIVELICQQCQACAAWECRNPGTMTGLVKTHPQWLLSVIGLLMIRAAANQGKLSFKMEPFAPKGRWLESVATLRPLGECLQIILEWNSPAALFPKESIKKPDNPELVALLALLDCTHMSVDYCLNPDGQQRLTLFTPLWRQPL